MSRSGVIKSVLRDGLNGINPTDPINLPSPVFMELGTDLQGITSLSDCQLGIVVTSK